MKPFLSAVFAFLLPLFAARADVANLAVTSDTFIASGGLEANNGGANLFLTAGVDLQGNIHRALYRFDVSSIPPGSVVTSAVFGTSTQFAPKGPFAGNFELHRMDADWVEGTGSGGGKGGPAQPGEIMWTNRMLGLAAWTNAGGDYSSRVAAVTPVDNFTTYSWSDSGLVAVVQGWVDGAANFGLLMKEQDENTVSIFQFGSREGGAPAALTVGYFVPPPPPQTAVAINIVATNATNAVLTLTWTNNAAAKYDVVYARSLIGTQAWLLAEANIRANTNTGTNVWTDPPTIVWPGPLQTTNDPGKFFAVRSLNASPSGMPVRLQVVVSNLSSPVAMTYPPDGSDRLFVCEQTGKVLVVDSSRTLLPTPFLDLGTNVVTLSGGYDERGLLGMAFHPGYATNRKFYVYYSSLRTSTNFNHESKVSEFLCSTTNANIADPNSERIVMRFDEPQNNHNGGNLAFGPDGYLYISTGDGGGQDDLALHPTIGNGQTLTNFLGKILRIDVNVATNYAIPPDNPFVTNGLPVRPEIFAYGFRNPWKATFDGTNCWVADVGQNIWEEVDLLRKGGNYGWRIMEGNHLHDGNVLTNLTVKITDLDYPIHEYKHGPLGISVIGGSVYRGTNYPALQGRYVFGDFSTNFTTAAGALYYLEETRPNIWERFAFWIAPTGAPLKRFLKSFGTDQNGEIYALCTTNLGPTGTSGEIRQLLPP